MSRLRLETLGKVALGVALFGSGGLYITRWQIQNKLRESKSYQEALQCLRDCPNALDVLGEPLTEQRVEIGDNNCYGQDGNLSWVTVPIVGKNRTADLRYWVTVTDREKNEFRVPKIELDIKGAKTIILLRDEPLETPTNAGAPA